jgi:hypothetical protein
MLRLAAFAAVLGLVACASDVLPRTERQASGPFESYEIAEAAYRVIEPGVTTVAKLRELGIDPATTPNLSVVNYVEVMRHFMPNDTIALGDLDPAVQGCIAAKTACSGWLLTPGASATQRTGDVSLDVLGFQRETEETGWSAAMLLLLADDVVVYKLWSGTPHTAERREETNPLGPAQDLTGAARGAIGSAIPKP